MKKDSTAQPAAWDVQKDNHTDILKDAQPQLMKVFKRIYVIRLKGAHTLANRKFVFTNFVSRLWELVDCNRF